MTQDLSSWWDRLHGACGAEAAAALAPSVCCPKAPLIYNLMFSEFQRRALLRLLRTVGPLGSKRLLDLGCGPGRWLRLLRSRGAAVVGIDVSAVALAGCSRRAADAGLSQMNASTLGLRDQSLDGAVSVTVLQHLSYPAQTAAVQELRRCLKPGGFALVIEVTKERVLASPTEPLKTFPRTLGSWEELFRSEGFRTSRIEPCLFLPLFRWYWRLRGEVRSLLKPAPERRPAPPSGPADHALVRKRGLPGWIDFAAYALLTPPSFLLELAVDACLPLRRRVSRRWTASHHAILFTRP